MKHDKKHEMPEDKFSKEYKERITVPNYRVGIKKGEVVGDMNLDRALAKYLFFGEMTTRKNPLKGLDRIPEQPLAKPGEDVRPPAPVGPNPMMREAILALSLSPHIVLPKIKHVR